MPKPKPELGVTDLLNELGAAVKDAKEKANVVAGYKASLAEIIAAKQAEIDEAQHAYDDAKIAADRLQDQARALIGELLPAPDPRFRVST